MTTHYPVDSTLHPCGCIGGHAPSCTTMSESIFPGDVVNLRQEVLRLMTEVRLDYLLPEEVDALINVLGGALIRRAVAKAQK